MSNESSSTAPTNDNQRMRLTIAVKAAARHADLLAKRADQLKSDFKAAKKAYKFARKIAKRAAKKAARRAEDLELWIKRSKSKPGVKTQTRRRTPAKRKRTRTRKPARKTVLPAPAEPPPVAITPDQGPI
jgi:hypothetical protein